VSQPLVVLGTEKLELLAAEDPKVAADLCRLLIAHNLLTSLNRMYVALLKANEPKPAQKEHAEGDRTAHFFLTVGILKEGLDVFRELDRSGWLDKEKNLRKDAEVQRLRLLLQSASDKNNRDSFYNRFIKPTRDDAVSHWRRQKIEAILADLAVQRQERKVPPLVVGYSKKAIDFRFPIADKLLVQLGAWPQIPGGINRAVERVSNLAHKFREFVDHLAKVVLT